MDGLIHRRERLVIPNSELPREGGNVRLDHRDGSQWTLGNGRSQETAEETGFPRWIGWWSK